MALVENLLGMSRDFFGFWGYLVVFLAIFIESFPFLGAFVPGGTITLLVCGFLTRLGYFVFWKVILIATFASVFMDIFGYYFGQTRAKGFFHRKARFFLVKHDTIEKVVRFINGHIGKSLILGKINPVTRSIAPFIVGNERINFVKFLLYTIVGSVLWIGSFVFLGYIFGSGYEVVVVTERYILWFGGILLGGFYVYYIGNLFKEFFDGKSEVKNGNNCEK